MPELPEVEAVRLSCDKHLRGRTLRTIDASDSRSVLTGITPRAFENALRGKKIIRTHRRGKYFWFEFSDRSSLLLHLGMTGWIEFPADGEPVPAYSRVVFEMTDGTRAAFTDPRRFGKIRLYQGSPEEELPVRRLGLDPLAEPPTLAALQVIFKKRKIAIKALLLDQTVFAGVGNWIADEILYQAGLRPDRICASLRPEEIKALRAALIKILRTAVKHRADSEKFPKDWLFHHRWGKKKDAQTSRGEKIRHDTIGGRTTAWVPARQK